METRTKAPCVIEKLLFCFSVALGQKPVVLNPKTRLMRSADKGVGEATAPELWTLCEVVESFKIVQTSILQSLLSFKVFWFRPCRRCVKNPGPNISVLPSWSWSSRDQPVDRHCEKWIVQRININKHWLKHVKHC